MSAGRVGLLIAAFAVLAFAVVCLRTRQTHCVADLLRFESRQLALRRERWDVQTRAARMRNPNLLRDRVATLQPDLTPPLPTEKARAHSAMQPARLTSHAPP